MSVGTAFHPRTEALNTKYEWREWAGFFAASVYADSHDIEYNAIREAAGLIDVSPLYKYHVRGPDAERLVDRVITRDATKINERSVIYTCWCNEDGKVIDDGTVARLDDNSFRWTAADPSFRWFGLNSAGLDVEIEDITDSVSALAMQGPKSREVLEAVTYKSWADVRYFGRRPTTIKGIPVDVSRTGYTGDLGYELWVDSERAVELWDALMEAGEPSGLRPAGLLALDVVRIEAGLILIEADFFSARHALIPEQAYSPFEIGLGKLVNFKKGDYIGKRALAAELAAGGPRRRLVGIELDWYGIENAFSAQGLPPALPAAASRVHVPVYSKGRQVGRVTSTTWSPTLKKCIGLASVSPELEPVGTRLEVEWTVEARRGRVPAEVAPLPFFDPPRKRA